ncbi:MAG: hypothetical protein HN904_06175 [Victivallales bacterium]|nr:hypothetical protein [Victivallales bacterium]
MRGCSEQAKSAPVEWAFADDTSSLVRTSLVSGQWHRGAVLVKENRRRRVFRCDLPGEARPLYVKQDLPCGLFDWLKSRFRCRARQEFDALAAVRAAGVAAAYPLGWAASAGGGFLATEGVPGQDLGDLFWPGGVLSPEAHSLRFLVPLARFLNRMVRAGVAHPDMHAGNIMVSLDQEAPRFALLDLYGVTLHRQLSLTAKRLLFFWLVPLLEELPQGQRETLLEQIAEGDQSASSLASWPEMVRLWARLRAAKWRGWKRRLLGQSSLCERTVDPVGVWLVAGDPARRQAIRQALALYLARDSGRVALLKDDHKRRVARVQTDGGSYVVKEYRHAAGHWHWRPDRLGWLNTARIRCLSVRIAICPAWVRGRSGEGYLIQEDVGSLCLHDYLSTMCPTAALRRPWGRHLASCLAYLHLCACFHADLKTANWQAGPRLKFSYSCEVGCTAGHQPL